MMRLEKREPGRNVITMRMRMRMRERGGFTKVKMWRCEDEDVRLECQKSVRNFQSISDKTLQQKLLFIFYFTNHHHRHELILYVHDSRCRTVGGDPSFTPFGNFGRNPGFVGRYVEVDSSTNVRSALCFYFPCQRYFSLLEVETQYHGLCRLMNY